jgi:hypothetical protein
LPNDWQPTNARDDCEQVTKAREAAEALFIPKKQVERTGAPTSAPIAPLQVEQLAPRTPRIISIPPTMSVAEQFAEEAVHPKPKPKKREPSKRRAKVPPSQHGRVRALALYGMTHVEVADLYGVPIGVIECIVADGTHEDS